ncbi:MAG: NAD(P)-binding domain-containing protein [Vannielia sp.]|uniref:ornithine cyclodeaminase family protein n=1 Tax=Vannielia sp. TaxID=2813045 RepID=UPI003B8C9AE6
MTTAKFITYEQGEAALDWIALTDALAAGHALPRAEIEDSFLYRRDDTLLSRAAWIDGLGSLVKTATIFPGNAAAGKPAVNGAVTLFSDRTGEAEAFVDFHLVTKWKTAGDSLLAARRLARPESRNILILGAGTVAGTLIEAYGAAFSGAKFTLWNRTKARAEALAEKTGAAVAEDLAEAVAAADIIATATMSTEPVLKGEWLQPGQHIDLIGAYRPDMREADDAVLTRARLFVDSRATTVGHIGELKDPLARGVIGEGDIVADYYQLDAVRRESAEEITVAKNGGGAHLDLMTARHILDRVGA